MASFSGRQLPTGSEFPFTRLFDSRAVDAVVSQVRNIDDYPERRRKLDSGPNAQVDDDGEEGEKSRTAGWKAKAKAIAKASAEKNEKT